MSVDAEGPLFLGLDIGTQGTKALLCDARGVRSRGSVGYGLIPGLPPGAAEQHPETWVEAAREAIAAAVAAAGVDPAGIAAIGVSGQQHGFVALDGDGAVIRPAKLWCDTSTSAQAAALSESFGAPLPTGFTASKIRWLAEEEPGSYDRLRHVLLPHDYLNYRLTGVMAMEPGDASGTGFFDPVTRDFDPARVAATAPDLAAKLPPIQAPGTAVGRVNAAGAALFGVPPGALVSTGGGDNMMAALGSGAVRAGVVVMSLGTSGTVFCHADQPVVDPAGRIAGFCGSAGGWLPLLCVMNLTGVTEEVATRFGLSHADLTARAAAVPPGCDGLRWLPFLNGERVPDLPTATGILHGMRPGCLDPGVLYRAAIEGTSLNLAWGIDHLRSLGVAVEELRLVGGAAANELWRQILADVIGVPVRVLEETEAAALGAAVQARWVAAADGRGPATMEALHPLLDSWVRTGEDVVAPGRDTAAYVALRRAFADDLARFYGVE